MNIELKQSTRFKFIMVGLGATGSQLLPFLTQLLNNYSGHNIVLLDGDMV